MKAVLTTLFTLPQVAAEIPKLRMKKNWIINIACQEPVEFGYAAETWTYSKLAAHIHKTAEAAGYTRLSTIS